jgi:hypothetical protein
MNNESPNQLETRLKRQYSLLDMKSILQEELEDIKDLIEEVNEPQPHAWSFRVC